MLNYRRVRCRIFWTFWSKMVGCLNMGIFSPIHGHFGSKQWIEVSDVTYPFVNLKYWQRNLYTLPTLLARFGKSITVDLSQKFASFTGHDGPYPVRGSHGLDHQTHWSVIRTMHYTFFCKHEADVPLICSPDAQYIQFWWNQHVPSLVDWHFTVSLLNYHIFDGWSHVKSHLRCWNLRFWPTLKSPFLRALAPSRCMDPDNQPAALEESRPCNGPEAVFGPVLFCWDWWRGDDGGWFKHGLNMFKQVQELWHTIFAIFGGDFLSINPSYPLVMTNIAMGNGPFIDGLPIKNGDFPWLC